MKKIIKKVSGNFSKIIIMLILISFLTPLSASAVPVFTSISATQLATNIPVGSTYQLSALAIDATGWPVSPQPAFTWASSDTAVAMVSATGLFTGLAVGNTIITVSSSGISATTTMAVSPVVTPVLTSINVSPANSIITTASTKQFSAIAYDSSGIAPLNPQPAFTWASSNLAVGTINASGLFTPVAPGSAIISASSGAITGTTTISVVSVGSATFSTISIQTTNGPLSGNIAVGAVKQLTATAWDSSTMMLVSPQPSFTWASTNNAVATVNATGLFTAVAPGAVTITASSLGVVGSSTPTVVSATPVISAIYVSPNPTSFNVGSSSSLVAQAYDQFGVRMAAQPTFVWSSSSSTIATIDAAGLFTAVAPGAVTITASSNGVSGTLNITVVASGASTLTAVNITQFPINNTLQAGQGWGLAAVAVDQTGATFFPPPTINWSSSNAAVATISATPNIQGFYILTAQSVGTTTIMASGGGVSGTAILTVTPAPQVMGSIVVSPTTTSAAIGSTQQFTATAYDNHGIIMSPQPTPISFQSNNPAVATVNANGLATAILPGNVSIFASYGIFLASASLTVTNPAGTFGITPSAGAGGTISPSAYTLIASGGSQAYVITPNAGYQIAGVLVDGVSQGATTTFTFTNVLANHTISATFTAIPPVTFNIISSAGVNGTISPLGTTTVVTGGGQSYTVTPTAGYSVANVLVDGVSQGATTTYAFTNVLANHTISATFMPTPVALNNLTAGWNLVGWTGVSTTADAVASANAGVNIISRFDNATKLWTDYIVGVPLNKFTINPGDGLFIHKL